MSGIPRDKRAKSSCVFYGAAKTQESPANCRLTTYKVCNPDTCPWYKSKKMMEASYEKARQNYLKAHGRDDYYALGYGPKDWRGQKTKDWDKEDKANDGTH